jgi:hypothetical protein
MPNRWFVSRRRGRSARGPLQRSETVLDPIIYLVRHSRSANCGRGSTPAATAKGTERARVRAHRYGYSHRNTEHNSGAEHHSRNHQMPSHWSRCMLRFKCSLPARWVWAGDGGAVCLMASIVARRRGLCARASAKPRYLLPATLGQCANDRILRERRSAVSRRTIMSPRL